MKYIGQVIEGRWLVRSYKKLQTNHYQYTLMNIYNGMEIDISDDMLRRIIKEETTLGKHMSRLIKGGKTDAVKL